MVSKSSQYHLVIEEYDKLNDKIITESILNDYLKDNESILFYAFIKHDNDIDIDGVVERNHYHLIIKFRNPYSKTTVINDIASKLLINKNIISCRKCLNFVLSVQYLVHQNDKDKYQYDLIDCWTNDSNEFMNCIINNVSSYDLDIDYLITLVNTSDRLETVYRELGLKNSRTYRSIITDLWKERRR